MGVRVHTQVRYARCQDCHKSWSVDSMLFPPPNLDQRVAPGDEVPAGECPECGSLCFLEMPHARPECRRTSITMYPECICCGESLGGLKDQSVCDDCIDAGCSADEGDY